MTIFHLIDAPVPLPVVAPLVAASASSLLTLSYVGGLYISTATRIGLARSKDGVLLTKDDAVVVKSRLRVATTTTLISLGVTCEAIRRWAYPRESRLFGLLSALRVTGIALPAPSVLHDRILPLQPSLTLYSLHHVVPSIAVSLLLTSTLFFGPLVVAGLDGALIGQRRLDGRRNTLRDALKEKLGNVWGVRNYIVGPLTEEVIFRGCIVALHALAGFSKPFLIFATPLYFGIAHLHHAYEGFVHGGRTRQALRQAALTSVAQCAYTCLFGWYANFLLLRTNSLLAPFVAHTFCNVMGLPNPVEAEREHPKHKWLIRAAHLVGIVGFGAALFPITKPGLFGGSWYWR